MGWRDHLQEAPETRTFPWVGGRKIYSLERSWRVEGAIPREFGWYSFELARGRSAKLIGPSDPDYTYVDGRTLTRGYVVGDRFIPEKAGVEPDPDKLLDQTTPIFLVEPGLDRFTLVQAFSDEEHRLLFAQQLFDASVEDEVRRAFVDRKESLDQLKGVTPALDLAFRFATRQRQLLEERRAELERQREAQRKRDEAAKNMGTGPGRRTLAAQDFEAAARAALAVGGAVLLDARPGRRRTEMVVQYRFENRRMECVADKNTLQIIDAGICLTDHYTNEKGDTYFTLESLPAVIRQAIKEHKLVVYRHVDGDFDDDDEDWDD